MANSNLLVGIPVLHRYDLLEKCIQGVLNSSIKPERIVIIDNGKKYSNPKLDVITPEFNLGVSSSWNLLNKIADDENKEILILNDDIVIHKSTIEEVINTKYDAIFAFAFGAFSIKKCIRESIGYFDDYLWPMYWEDCDYYWRMKLYYKSEETFVRLNYDKCIHLNGGSQTRNNWTIPWEERVKRRIYKKWGEPTGNCGNFTYKEPYLGEVENYFQTYWEECYNPSYKDIIDTISTYLYNCNSVLIIGLEVGRYTMAAINSGIKEIYAYDNNRNPEYDYMRLMCKYRNVKLTMIKDVNSIKNIDSVIIYNNHNDIIFDDLKKVYNKNNLTIYAKNTI